MTAFATTRSLLILVAACVGMMSVARADVVIVDKDDFKFSFSGYVEGDAIHDTTRSFTEIMGNRAVAPAGTLNGENGRTQFSVRNSRLAFKLVTPPAQEWKTLGYVEFDLQGYNAAATSSEASLYTGPNFRLRHAYLQSEKDGLQIMAGQYWQLLGWQPYYFFSSVDQSPLPGMLYSRLAQLRGTQTIKIGDKAKLETALAILRPPQADGSMPDFQGGVRFSTTALQSGYTGSSSGIRRLAPMSVAVSGAYRQYAINDATGTGVSRHDGYAVAGNLMIPLLPSRDGKSFANTLSLIGEVTVGSGDGDQFNQWSGNNTLLTAASNATSTEGAMAAGRRTALDGGIGDYDTSGVFHLVKLTTFNLHAQYHLPWDLPDFIDVGYGQIFSSNMTSLVGTNGLTSAGLTPYNRDRMIFANYIHDFSVNLRAGIEYVYTTTNYADAAAYNSRYQASAWFFF